MGTKSIVGFALASLVLAPQLFLARAEANAPVLLGPIARTTSGRVDHMSQYDADHYCKSQGTRLPTIRHLAIYAQNLGARGIRDTLYPGTPVSSESVQAEIRAMKAERYVDITVLNASKELSVDFYYNRTGYQAPEGDLGDYVLWSSSVVPDEADFPLFADIALTHAHVLDTLTGDLSYGERHEIYNDSAVRCVLAP